MNQFYLAKNSVSVHPVLRFLSNIQPCPLGQKTWLVSVEGLVHSLACGWRVKAEMAEWWANFSFILLSPPISMSCISTWALFSPSLNLSFIIQRIASDWHQVWFRCLHCLHKKYIWWWINEHKAALNYPCYICLEFNFKYALSD